MAEAKGAAANNLRELRRRRGLAVWGLAARVGTSPATVSAIERWGYRPGAEVRERLARVLGVHVSQIWPDLAATER